MGPGARGTARWTLCQPRAGPGRTAAVTGTADAHPPHHLSSLPVASTGRRLRPLCSSGDRRRGRVWALLSFAHWSFKVPPTRGLPLSGALVFPRALYRILQCLPAAEEGPLEGSGRVGEPRAQSQPLLPRRGGLGPLLCCGDAGVMRAFALWPLPSGVEIAVCGRTGVGVAAARASFARCARSRPGSSPHRPASWREVVLALRLPLWGRWAGHTPRGTRTRSSSSQVTFYAQKLFSWCSVFVSKRRVRPCGERSCLGAGPPGGGRPAWLCCSPRWARRVGPQRPCASRGPPGPPLGLCSPLDATASPVGGLAALR